MTNIIRGRFQQHKESEKKAAPVYRLLVEVAFSSPPIQRHIEISGKYTLADLHEVINSCFGWDDKHSHRFFVGKVFYQPKSKESNARVFDEAAIELHELEEWMRFIFTYFYDAGAGWECSITLLETLPVTEEMKAPCLLAWQQAGPPPEFYDIHDYLAFLSDLETAAGNERRKLLADHDLPADFDPHLCNPHEIAARISEHFPG